MRLPLRLIILFLLALQLSICLAKQTPAFASREIDITAPDRADLSLRQYPAQGKYLAIWIASGYGLSARDVQMARKLAKIGVEVWQIDFAQSLFQVGGSNFLRKLNPHYVVDLINAAQTRTHKKVVLISHSYGAIPALRGATLWQQSRQHGRLLGVILFSPDLYASIPELGLAPNYLPIAHKTNIPLVIYQAGKRGNAGQFPRLLSELTRNNQNVFFKVMPAVTSPMYPGDTSAPTRQLLRKLPLELSNIMHMLDRLPSPAHAPQYTFLAEGPAQLDTRLKPYRAQPQPRAITLLSANDRHYNIRNYKGKVSIINFWASWCHPCREEIPSLNRLRNKMRGKPFQLISVNYAENAKTIKDFLKEVRVDYPVLLDPKGKVSTQWNVIAYPSTFVIGADGKIHYGVNAAIDWDAPQVIHLLDDLMPTQMSKGRLNKKLASLRQSQTVPPSLPGSNPTSD